VEQFPQCAVIWHLLGGFMFRFSIVVQAVNNMNNIESDKMQQQQKLQQLNGNVDGISNTS